MPQDLATPPQAVAGLAPPQLGEARVREAFMALDGVNFPVAVLAAKLVRTYFLAPVGFLLLLPLFLLKFAPFLCKRYTITNRRLLIQRGWKPAVVQEMRLADIAEVALDEKMIDSYFLSADIRVIGTDGKTAMTLTAVPEAAGFRFALLNARRAYGVAATAVIGPFKPASDAK